MPECVFCSVSTGKTENHIVGGDDFSIAFLDKNPSTPGHVLVIPRRHVERLDEFSLEELKKYFGFISRVEKAVLEFSGEGSGYDIVNHYRPFIEESEMVKKHLHFHVIPRKFNDKIFMNERIHLSDNEMKGIADMISEKLGLIK
ncbi:MAG: HIT family protein [Candidatus Marsarchaeota archaeon]|nr:HIT family protein [Candidatus Marsarchaeota archaeon]